MKSVILLSLLVSCVIIYGEGHVMLSYPVVDDYRTPFDDGHVIVRRSPDEHGTSVTNTTSAPNSTTTKGPEIGAPFNAAPLADSAGNDSARRHPKDKKINATNVMPVMPVFDGTPHFREHGSMVVLFVCLMACLPKEFQL